MLPQFLRLCNSLPSHLRATARHLWSYVNRKRYLSGDGAFVWPSRDTLAAELGITLRTLRRHLAELAEGGWLRKVVRKVEGWVRRGWELLNPSDSGDREADQSTEVVGGHSSGHGRPLSDSPPLYEPELNQHPTAHARATEEGRAGEGGGMVGLEHPRAEDRGPSRTTAAAQTRPAAEEVEHGQVAGWSGTREICTGREATQGLVGQQSSERTSRSRGQPRNADQARAAELWARYEARRIREADRRSLLVKRHRKAPLYRDLTNIVALVDYAQASYRHCDEREDAWAEVERYAAEVWDVIDEEPNADKLPDLFHFRADGYEWSPTRFDKVMHEIAADRSGRRAEAAWTRRQLALAEQRRLEDEEHDKHLLSPEQIAEAVDRFLAQSKAAHGQVASA